jgi:arsenate reductase
MIMKNVIIYHNPRCGKSRKALEILKKHGIQPKIREYLKEPLSSEELRKLVKKLNIKPIDWIRQKENIFKEKYKGRLLTDEQWIEALAENPILMERPVIEYGESAIIARDEMVLEEWISKNFREK